MRGISTASTRYTRRPMTDLVQNEPVAEPANLRQGAGYRSEFEALLKFLQGRVGTGVETIFFSGFSLQRPADCALLLGMLADADGNPIYPLIYVLQSPDVMSERRDAFFERLIGTRSEERRVGKECVSTCRSRGWPY